MKKKKPFIFHNPLSAHLLCLFCPKTLRANLALAPAPTKAPTPKPTSRVPTLQPYHHHHQSNRHQPPATQTTITYQTTNAPSAQQPHFLHNKFKTKISKMSSTLHTNKSSKQSTPSMNSHVRLQPTNHTLLTKQHKIIYPSAQCLESNNVNIE